MANKLIDFLRDAFADADNLNLDQIRKITFETATYLQSLEATLQTGDAKAREEAVTEALTLKEYLDSNTNQPSKFSALETLSNEDREMVTEMTEGLKLVNSPKPKAKKNKLKPIKLS